MSTTILSIESSCDETAAAIVVDGREVKSNIIYSQIELHKLYGGVVPEIASRKHVEKVNQVIRAAIEEAHVTWDDIDAVAVTYGPGLVGALLVGVSAAKAVAYAKKKPLVGVHHIEGHIAANYIEHPDLEPPFMCMVASGGHSHLVYVKDYTTFEIVGQEMMQRARHLTRSHVQSDLDIRADRRLTSLPKRAIKRQFISRVHLWKMHRMIFLSVA